MSERIDCLIATEQLTWYHANELGIATNPAALETPIAAISVFLRSAGTRKILPTLRHL